MRNPSLQGRLGIASLPRVVRDLWSAGATGILHLSSGTLAKKIFFKNGNIVFAATNVERERIGERLVRAGKIKRSILELAFRVMERSHERFGKTMVDWGWISPGDMQQRIAEQIKDIIYSVFTWGSGDYRFEPADQPVAPELLLELKTAEVIWEGCRRIGNLKAIREGVGDPKAVVRLGGGKRLGIPLGQQEGFFLARVDGRSTISEILSSSPLEEPDALRCIYALLLAGVLERDEHQSPASPNSSNARRNTNPNTVAPDATPQDDSSEIAATFGKQTPSGSPGVSPPKPSSEADSKKKEATARYNEGKLQMEAGHYFDAVSCLDEAVQLDPDQGKYHRVLAQLLSQNPSCTEASQEHFERAIELDPNDREAFIGLANLLKQTGHSEQARRVLGKAAAINRRPRKGAGPKRSPARLPRSKV